jgi:hypothetical protein
MATVSINSGTPVRFENAGVIRFVTASDSILPYWIVKGSLSFSDGRRMKLPQTDRGANTAIVVHGDQRQSTFTFRLKLTKDGALSSGGLLSYIDPTPGTTNAATLFTLQIDFPDGPTASTGVRGAWANSYLQEAVRVSTSADDADEWEFTVASQTSAGSYTTY